MNDWIGYRWLARKFDIETVQPFVRSSRIGKTRATTSVDGISTETYSEAMRPEPSPAAHLAFALKHEGVHLEFLARLFAVLPAPIMSEWTNREPSGQYARRAGFLFEWFTGRAIDFPGVTIGNYVLALPENEVITATKTVNVARWRVRDNLPGSRAYCPLVRRTDRVRQLEDYDCRAQFQDLEAQFGAGILLKSAVWLTVKESRSSFAIEHEENQVDKVQRFARAMEARCGKDPHPLEAETLAELQAEILGSDAIHYGLRASPVFVGEKHRFHEVVHYIAPHWNDTAAMLGGLEAFATSTTGASSVVRAAVLSFGFVYIHPMSDGNGRISRFLINDTLRRDGAVPAPYILPVSATIIRTPANQTAYDWALEDFSKPFMARYSGAYSFGDTVECEDGLETDFHFSAYDDRFAWAYPDLTTQTEYLGGVIQETIEQEMRQEAQYLREWRGTRQRVKDVLEAPDIDIDRIINAIRQNQGVVSKTLVGRYPLLAKESLTAALSKAVMGKLSETKPE